MLLLDIDFLTENEFRTDSLAKICKMIPEHGIHSS